MERPKNVPLSLDAALTKARAEFSLADPAALAGKAYAEHDARGGGCRITLPYFGEWYAVGHPGGAVALSGEESRDASERATVPVITQVVLLHYLLNATGTDLAGRWVSYHELPQGTTYERAFQHRAIVPLESAFGYDLQRFVSAGLAAGGERARLAEASFYFRVLPKVPLMCLLWLGDDEVPPGVNILFDAAAGAYLPSEDLAYLGIALSARLLGAKHGALLT